jgi:hypothetical protein
MKAYFLGLAAGVWLVGCGDKPATPAKSGAAAKKPDIENNSSGNPVTAPVDYLGAVNKAKKFSVKQADLASVKQAIQLFKSEEERFPTSLKELVDKKYLPALPQPPYQMKYTYNPATGEANIVAAQ